MAKYGEGDNRWIVQDRADGANVHNWHWAEKDCMEWSRRRLGELIGGLTVLQGEGGCWIRTGAIEKMDGEAYVNIRKGKIIPGYELHVRLGWEGEVKDSVDAQPIASVKGFVELPYIADENHDEDPEVKIALATESADGNGGGSAAANRLRDAMLARGKPLILERIRTFVKDIQAGGPARDELEKAKAVKPAAAASAAAPAAAPAASGAAAAAAAAGAGSAPAAAKTTASTAPASKSKKESSSGAGKKSIAITQRFHCRPSDLYETLMDEKRWMAFTQSKAKLSRDIGGTFSLFDGSVTGVNQRLDENKLIMQKWRFSSWPDGHYSTSQTRADDPGKAVTVESQSAEEAMTVRFQGSAGDVNGDVNDDGSKRLSVREMRNRFNASNDRVPLAPKGPIRPNTSIAVDWVTKGGKNAVHRGDSKFVPRPGVKEEGSAPATSATRPPADSNSAVADPAASAAAGASESNTGDKGNGTKNSSSIADSDTWETRIRALEAQLEKANVETAFLKARNTELQARLLAKDKEARPQVVKTRIHSSTAAAKAAGEAEMRGGMGGIGCVGTEGRGSSSSGSKSSSGGDAGKNDSSSGRSSCVSGDEESGREDVVTGRGGQWSTVEDGVTSSDHNNSGMPLELQLAAAHARIAVLERLLKARANQSPLPRLPSASSPWKPIPRPPLPSPASQAPAQSKPHVPSLVKEEPRDSSGAPQHTGAEVQHEGRREEGLSVTSRSGVGGNAGMNIGMRKGAAEEGTGVSTRVDSGVDAGVGTEAVAEGGVVLVVRPWDSEGVARLQQELAEARAVQQATAGKLKVVEQQLGRVAAVRDEVSACGA
ncbi:unnamed protein product [Closterium sp. NIES-53]